MAKRVEIEFVFSGSKVDVEAKGFEGEGCVEAIDELIEGLGDKTDTKKKTEYHQQRQVKRVKQK